MKKYWIHSLWYDILFFLSPPFLVLFFIFLFQKKIEIWQEKNTFLTWLFLIVFIDVAHVYATLYKTYFNPIERNYFKNYLIKIPIFSFFFGMLLYSFGSFSFWSILAYIAVFHFIRQQYGFLRLYTTKDSLSKPWLDQLIIYNATLFPMFFWFLSSKRNYNWFVENEFFIYPNKDIITILKTLYFLIIGYYILQEIWRYIKTNSFNVPKNLWIIGTSLSWYFGIVYFNSDILFTLLNVISHGIPYIALIYSNQYKENHIAILPKLNIAKGLITFLIVIVVLAILEEGLWDIFIWKEHITTCINLKINPKWEILFVPLLTVPQFSHYLLDGIIWKRKKILQ